MRIDARPPALGATSVANGRRAEGNSGSFSLADSDEPAAARSTTAAATLTGLDTVLALQGGEEQPQERRRRRAQRGHDLLDGLDRLKAALLTGRVATGELQAIAGRLAERAGTSGDPRLDGLIADIELRAAVEIAKLRANRAA